MTQSSLQGESVTVIPQSASPRSVLRDCGLALFLLAAIAAVFWPVVRHDFTSWDDERFITRNPLMNPANVKSIQRYWKAPYAGAYIPATYSAWTLAAMADPSLAPRTFHLLNLGVHALCALLVLGILKRLFQNIWVSCAGALIFALHPVQVETVAWIGGLRDLLGALFALASIWQYIAAAQSETDSRWPRYGVATITFVLAMLANPATIVTPLIVMAIDGLVLQRPPQQLVRWAAPWIFLAVPCAIWTRDIQRAPHIATLDYYVARPLVAADALAFYLWKLVWPARLGFDYGRTPWQILEQHRWGYATWIVPVGVAILLVAFAKRAPALAAGGFIFVAGLLSVLGLMPFEFQKISTVADHYLYLPMLGIALAVAWAARRRGVMVVAIYAIIACGAWSYRQTWHWQNADTLFTHTLDDVNPRSYASFNSLALAKLDTKPATAMDYASKAIAFRPDFAPAHVTRGTILHMQAERDQAIAEFRIALHDDPRYVPALTGLATVLTEGDSRDVTEAIETARRAISINRDDSGAHFALGASLARQEKVSESIDAYRRGVELDPRNANSRSEFAMLLALSGKKDEAIEQFKAALAIDPNNPSAKRGIAMLSSPAPATTRSSP